jgi:hypothetical protein
MILIERIEFEFFRFVAKDEFMTTPLAEYLPPARAKPAVPQFDAAAVLRTLHEGLATKEHAHFASALQARRK